MAMPSSSSARLFYRAAKQRFEDAEFLLDLGRTTAAVYLAGYSVECVLKSLVLASVPRRREAETMGLFRGARAHDYDWLWHLYAARKGAARPMEIVTHFARVNAWSTDMRYSPGTVALRDAVAFVKSAFEIIQWADERL